MPDAKQLRSIIARLTDHHEVLHDDGRNDNNLRDDTTDHPKIAIAISGGPDSLALLWLMHQYYEGKIYALTVDHGLRSEAADEAQYVANICKKMDVPHQILKPVHAIRGNIQSQARTARYALLQQWAHKNECAFIATAHHADDQLETMIMRINRASGVSGLCGIRERNGNIIRPLLNYRKSDLIAICSAAQITPIDDPSNSDDNYDRVRVRQWIEKCDSLGLKALINPNMAQKTASHMNDAETALQYSVDILANERIKTEGNSIILDASKLPYEYQRRLFYRAIQRIDPTANPRGNAIQTSINGLKNNEISMISDIKCAPIQTNMIDSIWIWELSKAPPRRHS